MEKRELWRCLQISFGRPGVDSGNFSKGRQFDGRSFGRTIWQFLPDWYLVFAFFSVAGNFLQAREGKSVAWCEKAWPELELN